MEFQSKKRMRAKVKTRTEKISLENFLAFVLSISLTKRINLTVNFLNQFVAHRHARVQENPQGSKDGTSGHCGMFRSMLSNGDVRCIHVGLLCVQELARDRPTPVIMQASSTTAPVSIHQLITGVKSWLPNFSNWKSRFIHREGNNAAHLLARQSKVISDCTIWVEDSPPIIASQIMSDVAVLGLNPIV